MSESILKNIEGFKAISLSEMDDVALLKRTDTKFVLSESLLHSILQIVEDDYSILEINGERLMNYKSLYFDTPAYKFYSDHHNGKIRRTKIRMRQYVNSDLYFFEIKMKDGRGNTRKRRIPIPEFTNISSPLCQSFIKQITGQEYELQPTLWNSFQRITLVNINNGERVTVDINLTFNFTGPEKTNSNLAIIELKQSRYNRSSPMFQALKENCVHAFGFSKYCLGMTQLYGDIKYNAFKPKILRVKKITA